MQRWPAEAYLRGQYFLACRGPGFDLLYQEKKGKRKERWGGQRRRRSGGRGGEEERRRRQPPVRELNETTLIISPYGTCWESGEQACSRDRQYPTNPSICTIIFKCPLLRSTSAKSCMKTAFVIIIFLILTLNINHSIKCCRILIYTVWDVSLWLV